MSDYRANRRNNLFALEKQYATLAHLEERTGVSASYLSQLKKFRHMGDKTARRIEKKLTLPEGWMDVSHPTGAPPGTQKATGGLAVPFEPNQRTQYFLEQYLNAPEAMRVYLEQKLSAIAAYVEKLTPFQRKNIGTPPSDPQQFAAWSKELEEELARVASTPGTKAEPSSKRRNDDPQKART